MLKLCGWCGRYLDGSLQSMIVTTGICLDCKEWVLAEAQLDQTIKLPAFSTEDVAPEADLERPAGNTAWTSGRRYIDGND